MKQTVGVAAYVFDELVVIESMELAENMEEAAALVLEVVPGSMEEAGTAEVISLRVAKTAGLALERKVAAVTVEVVTESESVKEAAEMALKVEEPAVIVEEILNVEEAAEWPCNVKMAAENVEETAEMALEVKEAAVTVEVVTESESVEEAAVVEMVTESETV